MSALTTCELYNGACSSSKVAKTSVSLVGLLGRQRSGYFYGWMDGWMGGWVNEWMN